MNLLPRFIRNRRQRRRLRRIEVDAFNYARELSAHGEEDYACLMDEVADMALYVREQLYSPVILPTGTRKEPQ